MVLFIFFWFGIGKYNLEEKTPPLTSCPSCSNNGSLVFKFYCRYATLLYIPLFPFKKYAKVECNKCDYSKKARKSNERVKRKFDELKYRIKIPKRFYAGSYALVPLIILIFTYAHFRKDLDRSYIDHPELGDRYKLKVDGAYSYIKVVGISTDSTLFAVNKEVSEKFLKVSRIDKEENYTKDTLYITWNKLFEDYDSGEIMSIRR